MTTPLLSASWLRRSALALGGLLGTSLVAQAQALNYAVANATSVAGTYTDLGAASTVIATADKDDSNSAAQSIGFTFAYNNRSFTQFVLNTNGLVRLGSAAPSDGAMFAPYETDQTTGTDPVTSTDAADVNLLMPFNFDLQAGSGAGGAEYRVATSGNNGSHVCTVQWKNVSDKSATNTSQYANFSFQLKLYEGSNRIEFVYGPATVTATTDAFRYATVGIKGSGSGSKQLVLATKSSATPWASTTFQGAYYTASAHNFRSTTVADPGRTYRLVANPANDAEVSAIYTYGKLATTTDLPHAVQAVVTNVGSTTQTNLVATLAVTGTNTFNDTKTIASLAAGASATVTFASYPTTLAAGTNTVKVSIPGDGNTANNTQTYTQQVAANRTTYINPGAGYVAAGVGVGAAGGVQAVKYALPVSTIVSMAYVTFAADASNTSTYQVLLYDATGTGGTPGNVLYTSAVQSRTAIAGTIATTIPSVTVPATFFIGVKELTTTNPGVAYQLEDPLRPATSYYTADGTTWIDAANSQPYARIGVEFDATAVCPAVTNVVATNITATSATLTFTPAATATQYLVGYRPTAGGAMQYQTVNGSPVVLTGLTPGTAYSAAVVTNCTNNGVSLGVGVTFTTLTPCVAPTNLAASNVTTSGATLTFTPPTANVGSYTVTYTAQGGTAQLVTATTSPVTLTGLLPSTTYSVSIVTKCSDSQTSAAATTSFTTLTPCVAVTNLAASNISPTGATLTFTPPASNGSSYTVTYTAAGGATQTQTATGSPVTLTGLTPSTAYSVSVVTKCSDSQTSAAAVLNFTTLTPCTAPTNLAASSVTTTGATLTFTPPASNAASYTVTYTAVGGTAQTVTATGSPVVLMSLVPSTTYSVSIVTKCSDTQTSTAATTSFTTLTPCTAVTGLTVSNTSTTSAVLTFTGASAGTSYAVTYTPTGGTAQTQTATGSPVTLAGLAPSTTYSVSVVTSCGSSQTSPAAVASFTTLTPCAAVTGLTAGSVTTTSATLTFTAPAAGATGFTVTYTAAGTTQTQTATGSPVILSGLTPGSTYTASIVTSCGGGQTSDATSVAFTTLTPCTAVTGLASGNITATSAALTFTGASAGTSYAVTYTPTGGSAQTQTATGSPVTLAGLAPGTTYAVSVVTKCSSQASTAANASFTTLAPAPTNVTASNVTATGVSIGFTPAAGASSYTLTYTPSGGATQTVPATGSPVVLAGLTPGMAYTVTVVANYPSGASDPASGTFTTPQSLAVHRTLAGGQLEVYPNPTRHAFTLSLPALGTARTAQLSLVNTLGQVVSQQTIGLTAGGTHTAVDVSSLPTGMYAVQVQVGGQTAITRLIVE